MNIRKYELYMEESKVWESVYEYDITSSQDVYDYLTSPCIRLNQRDREHFIVIALNAKAEGGMQAIMGIPEVIGWILSYTRLAAITMSKAGMALAFNYIVFGMIIATRTTAGGEVVFDPFANVVMLVIGIFLFCFLHLVVWTLGILSAGLHALRLQFVELMMRFYEGGGESFAPLQEVRTKTFFSKNTNNIKEV